MSDAEIDARFAEINARLLLLLEALESSHELTRKLVENVSRLNAIADATIVTRSLQ